MKDLEQRFLGAMNRLTKWRVAFTGWQLGTRMKGDPEGDAVRDHREVTIILRAEVSAIAGLLIKNNFFTLQEFQEAMIEEAAKLEMDYENRFPGIRAVDDGLEFDQRAVQTMKHWKP